MQIFRDGARNGWSDLKTPVCHVTDQSFRVRVTSRVRQAPPGGRERMFDRDIQGVGNLRPPLCDNGKTGQRTFLGTSPSSIASATPLLG